MNRQQAPIVMALAAAVGAFIVLLLLGNSFGGALVFAILAGLVSFGVSWFQGRNRT
jgi:F0F1-type ATP synthase membrane subunit a